MSKQSQKSSHQLNWKVGGPAGKGIMTTGLIFSKASARHGWYVFDYTEYPSVIQGGHNTYQVLAAPNKVWAQEKMLDVLVALDGKTVKIHLEELGKHSYLLHDPQLAKIDISSLKIPGQVIEIPLKQIAIDTCKEPLMANNVALGASAALLGLDLAVFKQVIGDVFGRKGEQVVEMNSKAAQAGFDFIKENHKLAKPVTKQKKKFHTMTGNEAISLGSIAGGLQLYVAYPMTPSSSILHNLAAMEQKADIVVKHAEDEIGTINMALGASFAGVRAAVGTSGGGFCYMTEAVGLAGVAELPLVVVESMRPGPALGMPTWTGQGDLLMVISASQDEFPRIVVAPGDADEALKMSVQAFDLAEKYQVPVIILADKYLSESRFTLEGLEAQYQNQRHGFVDQLQADQSGFFPRYEINKNGLSSRSVPGQAGGTHMANSYEHDEYGFATEESEVRVRQLDKRNVKWQEMAKEIPAPEVYKQDGAKLLLVSFGSSKGPLLAAQEKLADQGLAVDVANFNWLWPFPAAEVKKILAKYKLVSVIEGNSQGQLSQLITQQTGVQIKDHLHKYDGRPFYPGEIVGYVKKLLKK